VRTALYELLSCVQLLAVGHLEPSWESVLVPVPVSVLAAVLCGVNPAASNGLLNCCLTKQH
jgi:hypothetical protein